MNPGEAPHVPEVEPDTQVEAYYHRWDRLQVFLASIDLELATKPVRAVAVTPGLIAVEYEEINSVDASFSTVVSRRYKFAKRPTE